MSKQEFEGMTGYDYLSMTPEDLPQIKDDNKENLWSILLAKLHNEYKIEKNAGRTVFDMLARQIDFAEIEDTLDNYVTTIIENSQTGGWDNDNAFWNESWGAALLNFVTTIDPEGIQAYENSSVIYSDGDNNIVFPELIRGGIKPKDGAALRISDIYEADAGANFGEKVVDEENPIFYYDFTSLKIDFKHAVMEEQEDFINVIHYRAVEEIEYEDIRYNHPELRAYDDPNQVYGHINMNDRPIIRDGEYVETVLGSYEFYDFSFKIDETAEEITKCLVICFSPIFYNGEKGFLLGDEEVGKYLYYLFDSALNDLMDNLETVGDMGAYLNERILHYDTEGTLIDGAQIYGLVAATSLVDPKTETIKNSYAALLASTMHYVGDYGSIKLAEQDINEYELKYNVTAEWFEEEYDKYVLGRDNMICDSKYLQNAYFFATKVQQALFNNEIAMTSVYEINDLKNIQFLENAQESHDRWIALIDQFNDQYTIKVNPVDNLDDIKPGVACYPVTAPWVIPWYNINGKSYATVRGNDKNLNALTNAVNLQFTQDDVDQEWVRLIMPENIRNVEIEDLNRNFWVIAQVITGISAYLFDEGGGMGKAFKDLTEAILDMWENVEGLWTALAVLGQDPVITKIHKEVVPLTVGAEYPYLKYDNFDISSIGNLQELCEERLEGLLKQYEECHLVIIPEVRVNNYRSNYYSKVVYPGVLIANRNTGVTSWQTINYTIDLTESGHKDYTYGIREYSESQYEYYAPFSAAPADVAGDVYFELLRPTYEINAEYDVDNDLFTVNVDISYSDAAQEIITGESTVIWQNGSFVTPAEAPSANKTLLDITKGYYQGELVSSEIITT